MKLFRYIIPQLLNQKNILRKYCNSPESLVSVKFIDGVKTITMTDHKTRNALSLNMMHNLIKNIVDNNNDPLLRIIVIAAQGKIFSAGHNLKELSSSVDKSIHQEVFLTSSVLMNAIIDSPVPIIAKVDGIAAAAGCQLVAQCDLAICSQNSTFMTPGANFGIFCSTPGVALSRSVSKSTSMKMLLTGKPISAEEAKISGLVADVCETERLDETVEAYCQDIKVKSREVVELGKKFYYKQLNLPIKEAFQAGANIMVQNLQLKDGKEGIQGFIEKRKPIWTHGIKS